MRVALNGAIWLRGVSGTATVARSIATTLRQQPDVELSELVPPRGPGPSRLRNAAAAASWDMWAAGRAARHHDVLISPCNIGRAPRGVAHVLFVQDTIVLDHPELVDRGYGWYALALFGPSIRMATRVVTATRFAADCILRRWPRTPLEVLAWPAPPPARTCARDLPGGPFKVLMVGATVARKNHAAGIEAVRLVRLQTGADLHLELIGPAGSLEGEISGTLETIDPRGEWTRRRTGLSDSELHQAYSEAAVLLQPSLMEGFGLPLLEAAAHALPTVHSGASAMREVAPAADAGSGAPEALAAALGRLLDPCAYQAASQAALDVARRHTTASFESGLMDIVRRAAG